MDELVPNPDGCRAFEPNQFKKEKCKNCGRPWQEHLGVISEALVNSYVGAKRKATEDKLQKEADAKAQIKAKAVAKKKQQQAVEDEWLGAEATVESDDDDMGFRMFNAQDLAQAAVAAPSSETFKPLKVKNLIDFEECDVPEDLGSSMPSMPLVETGPVAAKPPTNPTPSGLSTSASSTAAPSASIGFDSVQDQGAIVADLLAEMDNLKHMLRNANEEKNIQVAIVKDEVAEKQHVIEDMKNQRLADQAEIASLREQLASASSVQQQAGEAEALRQQVAERSAEIERLKAAALLPLPLPPASDPAKEEELVQLRLEVEELRKIKALEAPVAPALPALSTHLSEVYAICVATCKTLEEDSAPLPATLGHEVDQAPEEALLKIREAATAVQAAAERSSSDRRQLSQKLCDAEVAAQSAMSAAALVAAKPPAVVTEASQEQRPQTTCPPTTEPAKEAPPANRQAALALREVRLNAERQLAWISKRMKTNHQDGRRSLISCP
jgi:hypothetical protein